MCITYAWQYSCGCLAPKPADKPIHRCTAWLDRRPCTPTPLYSYLCIPCSQDCDGLSDEIELWHERDDSHLYYGKFDGMTSAEDRYFKRSRSPEGCRPERPPMRRLRVRRVVEVPVVREEVAHGSVEKGQGEKVEDMGVVVEDEEADADFVSRSKRVSGRKK
ncbi:hypothetical protein EG329_002191 [Mollisiaceae sp. DMI_Dod_QoI]|nr:hypothetical protein EG329_002191 [Helotiales sp. DMI_Dod_QoI]